MKKIILIGFIIIIILVVLVSIFVLKLIPKPTREKWPSGTEFPREPTLEDELPTLAVEGDEFEDWWYGAVLDGDNGKTYFVKIIFHKTFASLTLSDLENMQFKQWVGKEFEIQKTSNSLTLKHSDSEGYAQIIRTPPDNSHLVIEAYGGQKLDLNFKSRGLPYWYGNGKGITMSEIGNIYVNGYEDLSTVDGTLYRQEKTIKLNGYGFHERAHWGRMEGIISTNWLAINLDQTYLWIVKTMDKYGYLHKDGTVSINGEYEYVGANSIQLKSVKINGFPEETHITVDTSFGKLEITGLKKNLISDRLETIVIYDYTGAFTYKSGTILTLTGGVGINGGINPW